MQYFRIGPTPWLSTSQPASVSIGEPQFPSWMNSPGKPGFQNELHGMPEMEMVGEHHVDILRVLTAEHRVESPDFPGKSAMPLFSTAGPFNVMNLKRRKSGVWKNCGSIILPSYAV